MAGGKGKGDGGSGGGDPPASSVKYVIELVALNNATRQSIIELNDNGEFLAQIPVGPDAREYVVGTVIDGQRVLQPVVAPLGWEIYELSAMNNSGQIVGRGRYDEDGDGFALNDDGTIVGNDWYSAGIRLTQNLEESSYDLDILTYDRLGGGCYEINNDGDIWLEDYTYGWMLYRDLEGTYEPLEVYSVVPGAYDMSDRDADGDVVLVTSYPFSRIFDTKTGVRTSLPNFGRATQSFVYSVNVHGISVGWSDDIPVIWSRSGQISMVPGWPNTKTWGRATSINDAGQILLSDTKNGELLYDSVRGFIDLGKAIQNLGDIPTGYVLKNLKQINEPTVDSGLPQIVASLINANGDVIPCILHPIAQGN